MEGGGVVCGEDVGMAGREDGGDGVEELLACPFESGDLVNDGADLFLCPA